MTEPAPPPAGEKPGSEPSAHWLVAFRWPLAAVAAVALVVALLWRIVVSVESAGRAAASLPERAAERIAEWAAGFLTGDVTERFLAGIPTVAPIGGGNLEVAVAESVETLSRSDEQRAFWDLLSLGTTTVEIRVPVTYRYHLKLDDPWRVTVTDGFCRVEAPALRPSLPPAVHTDRMERRAEESWLRFDAAERMSELEARLTPELSRMARDPLHLALVREPARQTVARFVRSWLLSQGAWRVDGVRAISVSFADERGGPQDVPATLVIGD